MAVAVSLINMKGGVGKTTVAAQLAHAVAADGLRVLAVDLDPQSNLSHSIMGTRQYLAHITANRPTVVQILQEYVPPGRDSATPRTVVPENVILPRAGSGRNTGPDLIPSRLELSEVLKDPGGREHQLARFLGGIPDRYDLTIIDCAPTESVLTQMAYFSSRYLIVPVKPEFLATVGLPLLDRSLKEFRLRHADHELEIAGLVVNDQSDYTSDREKEESAVNIAAEAVERGWRVFDYRIPYSKSYPKAARDGTPLARTRYAHQSRIDGFLGLKDEILRAVGVDGEQE